MRVTKIFLQLEVQFYASVRLRKVPYRRRERENMSIPNNAIWPYCQLSIFYPSIAVNGIWYAMREEKMNPNKI